MKEVIYTDTNGLSWLVGVSDDTMPKDYKTGIHIGPPDLTDLNLPIEQLRILQKRLVESHLVNAELIRGSRAKLHNTIKTALPSVNTKQMVLLITSIYQKEFFEE